jgi:CubicO group peptidase (beta-lactamase class C family)
MLLLTLMFVAPLTGATLPRAAPDDVGLSRERLARIGTVIGRFIDAGTVNGAVAAVARRGRLVFLEASGVMDREFERPMTTDAIFPIASMTEPVVSVAILMLMEEGRLHLDDPVSRFIPELASLTVAVTTPPIGLAAGDAPPFYPVPANRQITIQDLLTHTSGLLSGPISLGELDRITFGSDQLPAEWMPELAKIPLEFQPGERWAHSPHAGFDALLRIVEVISGETSEQFLRHRVFEPLGMHDSALWTPAMRNARLVPAYAAADRSASGAGIVSTAEDYLQFGQMLLNGGALNGARLLGPRTVDLLRSSFIKEFASPFDGRRAGRSFGLGVQVIREPAAGGFRVGAGTISADGMVGSIATHFWVDPTENVVGVVLLHAQNGAVFRDIENALMQSIVD